MRGKGTESCHVTMAGTGFSWAETAFLFPRSVLRTYSSSRFEILVQLPKSYHMLA